MVNSLEKNGRKHVHSTAIPLGSLAQCADALLDAVVRGVNRELDAYNLTPMDFAMIRQFAVNREWTATDLAQVLPVEVSAISRMVKKLVDLGLMSRRRSRRDRRVVYLKLTDAGNVLCHELEVSVHAYEDRLTGGISAQELGTFMAVISQIIANYDALSDSK